MLLRHYTVCFQSANNHSDFLYCNIINSSQKKRETVEDIFVAGKKTDNITLGYDSFLFKELNHVCVSEKIDQLDPEYLPVIITK